MTLATAKTESAAAFAGSVDCPTVMVAGQTLALPIERVHDVFVARDMTGVPHAAREIVGLLNLRGRVVTAVSLRRRLGLPDGEPTDRQMAVGLEHLGESYGLLVDDVGEVMKLNPESLQPNPVHMDPRWSGLSRGVHQLDGKLLLVLDVDAVLAFQTARSA